MYRPMLFNTEMVEAIISGRKTQTRRIAKPQPTCPRWNNIGWVGWDDGHGYRIKSPCETGDILWVRETFCPSFYDRFFYKAGLGEKEREALKDVGYSWKPSIHMPKEAARIFLCVKEVRIERLQEVNGMEILAEGVENGESNPAMGKRWENMQKMAFAQLWDSTIDRNEMRLYGWHADPWVWVIKFERCERPVDFMEVHSERLDND